MRYIAKHETGEKRTVDILEIIGMFVLTGLTVSMALSIISNLFNK